MYDSSYTTLSHVSVVIRSIGTNGSAYGSSSTAFLHIFGAYTDPEQISPYMGLHALRCRSSPGSVSYLWCLPETYSRGHVHFLTNLLHISCIRKRSKAKCNVKLLHFLHTLWVFKWSVTNCMRVGVFAYCLGTHLVCL